MNIFATAAVALASAWVFERLRVPSGGLLGPMIVVAALNLSSRIEVPPLPDTVRYLAYAGLGWAIGVSFTPETLAVLRSAAVPILIAVAVLLACGALLAWALVTLSDIDPATAFLAVSPGALTQMIAVSTTTGADSPLVATVHIIRVFAVLLISPFVVRFLPTS